MVQSFVIFRDFGKSQPGSKNNLVSTQNREIYQDIASKQHYHRKYKSKKNQCFGDHLKNGGSPRLQLEISLSKQGKIYQFYIEKYAIGPAEKGSIFNL